MNLNLQSAFDESTLKNIYIDLIQQMAAALELCLLCEGPLTWAAEQDARITFERANRVLSIEKIQTGSSL